ncbi:phospholipase D-like domain-containing protein [Streptomyces johnsoniae]|uniref:Phospholipase D-like domain-containing protein n=1 Tax=Streptomyces johnsoniae TaxID=3075532 RepID=A0ABU2S3I1_9ACTN|nr:phospholipase D-like domain-containing protein [Streptomyces sp. DSM 41886]MDT0443515.1 phospholipase D-like domain-containing protein [Streptomyces sp. DSM 41886]
MVGACLAVLLLPWAPAAAAEPRPAAAEPVMNGAVFNDPAAGPSSGTPTAAQRAVFDQLIGLIRATPANERIEFAMFEFTDGASGVPRQVVDSLLAAHDRGVDVRIILDSTDKNDPVHERLDSALGHSDSAGSWVVQCGTDRGCIGRNYSHEKFALFSRVVLANGATHRDVVFQSSSNLTDWYLFNSYNEAFTLSDATVYDGYRRHFADLNAGRKRDVAPDYFWTTPTGSTYRAHFYPRAQGTGDPMVNVLRNVECSYRDEAGVARQTDIRLVVSAFTQHRRAIAEELIRLRGENCWIDVVYATNGIEPTVLSTLDNTAANGKTLQLTPCTHDVAAGHEVRPHAKVMMTDGHYDDDIVPRVYTGSANFTHLENSDDSQLRIMGREVHDTYLSWFYDLRAACRA